MHRLLVLASCSTVLAFGAVGCATVESAEGKAAEVLIPPEQEVALGEQIHQELEKEGIRYIEDPVVLQRVNAIAAPIIRQAKEERPEFDYHIHVVDNPGSVNAFATPGGHIYIESGLIQAVDNEAELAGVIAHEAGHVTGRHAARNMVQAFGLQTVAAVALGRNPSELQQIAANVVAQGTLLAHSRAQETEADETGVVLSSKAGYDPQGLVQFLGKLGAMTGKTPRALTWLSTHPSSEDRVANLERYIRERNLRGSGGHESLAGLQQRLGGVGGAGRQQQP